MNRELRLFVFAVGLPAILLTAVGARLVYAEWRFDAHARDMGARRPPPPRPSDDGREIEREPEWDELEDGPHGPPPPVLRLFSEKYRMDGSREAVIFGCFIGLMILSFVSGAWLLMRAARRARLEALRQTDFVSNISHEFKTPLTTICLCAELAQDDGLSPERRKKALSAIMGESERLKRLVLNALDFSRLEKKHRAFDLRVVDVAEIARETCAAFELRFAGRSLHAPEGSCTATADAEAVRQILANLLDNAAHYAPQGDVDVAVSSAEGRACVSVADRGPGLSAEALRHVFDRFWRGDNSITREIGGCGLGLAIARGLAQGMGGNLTAENRPDGGAKFVLELKV